MKTNSELTNTNARVFRVSAKFFEVNGCLDVNRMVKAGESLAVVVDVSEEIPEILKYSTGINMEEVIRMAPDILDERKATSKCYILMSERLPKIGDDVTYASDEEIREMHFKDGELKIPYFFRMLKDCDAEVCLSVLRKLKEVFPENPILDVLIKDVTQRYMRV